MKKSAEKCRFLLNKGGESVKDNFNGILVNSKKFFFIVGLSIY